MIRYESDKKIAYFNNLKFVRDDSTGYYLNSTKRKRLHRCVWEYYNGKIPKGYHIHHKDHDKSNNDLSNLMLITPSKHESLHSNEMVKEHYSEMCKNLDENARPKASEWHGSTEGKKWHGKHGIEVAKNLKEKEFTCEYCGKKFYKKPFGINKFCSNKCKSAWRRKEGLDNERRICEYCGKEFEVNKYYKTRTCSRSCANKLKPRLPHLRKNKED